MIVRNGKKPELLIPASSLEVLKTAVLYGADAVYVGGEVFSLRAKAKNFSMEDMAEGIAFAHEHGVKVYVTANILAHNEDLEEAREYFAALRDLKYVPANAASCEDCPNAVQDPVTAQPDALIISDPGMFMIAREVWPDCEIHVSTQANNTNYETYLFWWKLGAKRVVSARELSLQEIREIRDRIPEEMEIESFIHGSMCISYSGRCLLSNYFTGRDANQGNCTHPCRWKYAVMEESRPGEYLPVFENERGTFLFNSKDLCMIEHVPEMIAAGIDSFKIEGRMKTALYVASVTRTYRKAIDDYFLGEEIYQKNLDWYRAEIAKCTYRQYSTGFYFGKPTSENQIYDNSTYVSESIYLGIVEEKMAILSDLTKDYEKGENLPWIQAQLEAETLAWMEMPADGEPTEEDASAEAGHREQRLTGFLELIRITQRNKFCVGDHIEIMKRDGRDLSVRVGAIYNEELEPMESAPHAKQKIWVWLVDDVSFRTVDVEEGDVLRQDAN
ncbi:MAG: U32 family peptidase [Lachnospiraceae bacterium]|nr:U32 family peptidase [Lachnospiraceae bacterium]